MVAAVLAEGSVGAGTAAEYVPGPGLPGPASEGRMFAIGSLQAWQLVQGRLKELELPADKTDRTNQLVLTKWRAPGGKGLEWMPAPRLPGEYVPERVRFEVFVSPFAKPARVYVGSLVEARKVASATATATVYNARDVNQALMREISKALGQEGSPIPVDREERRRLAVSLLKDDAADKCLRPGPPPKGAKLTPPGKIPLSEFEVLYPPAAVSERVEGTVRVEFTILEDGGVTGIRLLDPPLGRQLEHSALGAASLLLYTPTKLDECAVPTIMTYTVRYRLR